MNVDIRYQPAFATLFVSLLAHDKILAESGAMASMSSGVQMKTRFNGGFLNAIMRRVFGGEALFINEFSGEGEIVLTQNTPGDVTCIELHGNSLYLQSGSFIACGPNVKISVSWAGFASFFAGEGLFRLRVSGHGPVWFGAYGGIWQHEVQGEYVIDSGHLLAYEPTLSLHLGMSGGVVTTLLGGEGLIARLKGQGRIYLQSRSIEGLASWTNSHL